MNERDCLISTDNGRYIITDLETEIKASGATLEEAKIRLNLAIRNRERYKSLNEAI